MNAPCMKKKTYDRDSLAFALNELVGRPHASQFSRLSFACISLQLACMYLSSTRPSEVSSCLYPVYYHLLVSLIITYSFFYQVELESLLITYSFFYQVYHHELVSLIITYSFLYQIYDHVSGLLSSGVLARGQTLP